MFRGGCAGVAEVDGAVDAVLGGDDALGGEPDAEEDGKFKRGTEGADGGEAVQRGRGVEGVAVLHDMGSMAERGRKDKRKMLKFQCRHSNSRHEGTRMEMRGGECEDWGFTGRGDGVEWGTMYRLQFQSGRHAGRTLAVRQAVLTLGAGTGCHVQLPGDAMPDKAACLEENAAGVFFCGLAPGAATCNGEPVEGSRKLADGDVLGVAGTRLVFLLRERRAKKRSTRVSWGLMQPAAALASLALVAGEMALMGYLAIWPLVLILPETELADRKAAKVLREELAQEAEKEGKEKPGATAALSMPGVSVKDESGGGAASAMSSSRTPMSGSRIETIFETPFSGMVTP